VLALGGVRRLARGGSLRVGLAPRGRGLGVLALGGVRRLPRGWGGRLILDLPLGGRLRRTVYLSLERGARREGGDRRRGSQGERSPEISACLGWHGFSLWAAPPGGRYVGLSGRRPGRVSRRSR
ncbi:MAG: hypothetical protein LBW85_11185, partial [Deltaproteobacteria bacterium]|nr:hypothetical protein [Deltaproteobacteria bacterium]